jgi:Domain of unknown function (DUF3854)
LKTSRTLTAADHALFEKHRTLERILRSACIRRVSNYEARLHWGFRIRTPFLCAMDGLCFPYLVPESSHRASCRIRRDLPEVVNGRLSAKYRKPWGDPMRWYYGAPLCFAQIGDRTYPLLLVEAEKSVLSIQSFILRRHLKLIVAGIGGCWGWSSKREVQNKDCTDRSWLGRVIDFHYAMCRRCCILLDANVETNVDVQNAERRLIRTLIDAGATEVRVARLPVEVDVNGPDDYLSLHSDDDLLALLQTSRLVHSGRKPLQKKLHYGDE